MEDKKIIFKDKEYSIKILSYKNNDRLCLALMQGNDCDQYITVNVEFLPSKSKNYIYINNYCKKSGLEDKLIELGLIEKVGDIACNFYTLDLVKIDLEKLKEYDSIGFKLFEETHSKTKDNFNEIIDESIVNEFLKNDDKVTVVEGEDFAYIRKSDIPDYLVLRNKDVKIYDKDGDLVLSTIGCFVDKIMPDLRKELANDLVNLQFNVKEPKTVDFVSSYVADTILYKNLEKNKTIDISM